jgi:hypothetical protein
MLVVLSWGSAAYQTVANRFSTVLELHSRAWNTQVFQIIKSLGNIKIESKLKGPESPDDLSCASIYPE